MLAGSISAVGMLDDVLEHGWMGGVSVRDGVGVAGVNTVNWLKLLLLHSQRHWCGSLSCSWLV